MIFTQLVCLKMFHKSQKYEIPFVEAYYTCKRHRLHHYTWQQKIKESWNILYRQAIHRNKLC